VVANGHGYAGLARMCRPPGVTRGTPTICTQAYRVECETSGLGACLDAIPLLIREAMTVLEAIDARQSIPRLPIEADRGTRSSRRSLPPPTAPHPPQNLQAYQIYVVHDTARKQALVRRSSRPEIPGHRAGCARLRRRSARSVAKYGRAATRSIASRIHVPQSATAMLAAVGLGLGTCWVDVG